MSGLVTMNDDDDSFVWRTICYCLGRVAIALPTASIETVCNGIWWHLKQLREKSEECFYSESTTQLGQKQQTNRNRVGNHQQQKNNKTQEKKENNWLLVQIIKIAAQQFFSMLIQRKWQPKPTYKKHCQIYWQI